MSYYGGPSIGSSAAARVGPGYAEQIAEALSPDGGPGTSSSAAAGVGSEYAEQIAEALSPGSGSLALLQRDGFVLLPGLLSRADRCRLLRAFEADVGARDLADRKLYRSRDGAGQELRPRVVDMGRLRFGLGEYTYLREPLPQPLGEVRGALYEALASAANADLRRHRQDVAPKPFAVEAFPPRLDQFWELCRGASPPQSIPTCIVLQYNKGGHNLPHRDIYGCVSFPFQALTILNVAGRDFAGGEFYMQPTKSADDRRQHVALRPGDMLVFHSSRWHGSEPVRWGRRVACGLQFHLSPT